MQRVEVKRGSTLSLASSVLLPAGVWSATAWLKNGLGVQVGNLTVTLAAPVAPALTWSLLLSYSAALTAAQLVGDLLCDLRFVDGNGVVLMSPTFTVAFIDAITNG